MSRSLPAAALRRCLALLVVLAVAGTASACSRQADPPTQGEYVARADDICESTDERIEELQRDYELNRLEAAAKGESSEDQRPDRWMRAKIVPEYESLDSQLRGIRPPEDDATYLSDLYDDLSSRIEELRLSPTGGRDTIREDAELRKRFATYGMKVCGRV